jgi:hypothetical protein
MTAHFLKNQYALLKMSMTTDKILAKLFWKILAVRLNGRLLYHRIDIARG